MKSSVVLGCVLASIAVFIAFPAITLSDSDCDRAGVIRKHVADADNMPTKVKEDLLRAASELCPEKPNLSEVLKHGEELVEKGDYAGALKAFQTALKFGDKEACERVFTVARSLKDRNKLSHAQAFFGAGLSVCDDAQVIQEYAVLTRKGPDLEPKGDEKVVSKNVIIRSLLTAPDTRHQHDISADVAVRERPWREERRERHVRSERERWYDDEDAPYVTLRNILFEPGSATLTPGSRRQLDILGEALESRALRRVDRLFVDGHTDSIGEESTNCDLGYRRAKAVVRYLEDNWDVEPGRLVPRSFGEHYPVATNTDEEGRRLNRRVVIKNGDRIGRRADYMGERCR